MERPSGVKAHVTQIIRGIVLGNFCSNNAVADALFALLADLEIASASVAMAAGANPNGPISMGVSCRGIQAVMVFMPTGQ